VGLKGGLFKKFVNVVKGKIPYIAPDRSGIIWYIWCAFQCHHIRELQNLKDIPVVWPTHVCDWWYV